MKQLIKRPFFWLLFYFIVLLLPPTTLFSREFRKISPDFSSCHYDKNPPTKITFTGHDHSSSEAKLSWNYSIRPVDSAFTYSDQSNAWPDWSNTSMEDFQEYFQDIKPAKNTEQLRTLFACRI